MKDEAEFIEKTFILLSILSIKKKYYNESFVTANECNIITQKIKNKSKGNNKEIIITDKITKNYFDTIGEIFLKKDDIEDTPEELLNPDVYNLILDEKFIYNCLCEIKVEELINAMERSCSNCNTHCSGGPEGYLCDRWSNDSISCLKMILKR